MGCKLSLRVRVSEPSGSYTVSAFFHPRGCMGARQSHLDLNPPKRSLLYQLARIRGIGLKCWNIPGGIELGTPFGRVDILVDSPYTGLVCSRSIYVMISRSRSLYIGPLKLYEHKRRGE